MIRVTEYTADGKLGWVHTFPDQEMFEHNKREGIGYADGAWDADTHYILNKQPTERPASPVTLSDLTLLGVPTGSTLWVNGERYEGVEGNVELEFPLPGVYSLRVECFPYKDWEGEVTL